MKSIHIFDLAFGFEHLTAVKFFLLSTFLFLIQIALRSPVSFFLCLGVRCRIWIRTAPSPAIFSYFFLLWFAGHLISLHSNGERMLGNRTLKRSCRLQVLGSMDDETYIELLDSGLRNDNNSGTNFNFSIFRSYSVNFKINYNQHWRTVER